MDDLFRFCLFLLVLNYYNNLRDRKYVIRRALQLPHDSAWTHLRLHGDNRSFLTITGLSRRAFGTLHGILFPVVGGVRMGRPPQITSVDKLGMYLLFLGSRMTIDELCLIFGVVPSTMSEVIKEMMGLLVAKLSRNGSSCVKFPSKLEMAHYAELCRRRQPIVHNVIGFVDGLSIPVQCNDSEEAQKKDYNGYHRDTACNNVFAFSPTGRVIYACINYPGSWHDSMVSQKLTTHVAQNIGCYALCVDQGFKRSGEMFAKYVGPISKRRVANIAPVLLHNELLLSNAYTQLRQAAEWGMKALQGAFTRLKSRLTSDSEKRFLIIYGCVLLHNFQTVHVGFNQISTVFDAEYDAYLNMENYDRIARYFRVAEEV